MSRPLLVGLGACAALVLLGLALQLTSHPRDVGGAFACPSALGLDGGALRQNFIVHAGFFQLYLSDQRTPPPTDDETFWSTPAKQRHLAAAPGILGVQTPYEGEVQIQLEVGASTPPAPELGWEHVVEGPLALPSGMLAVRGCPDSTPVAPCLALSPGDYRVRVSSTGWRDGAEDHYLVEVWPAKPAPIAVLATQTPELIPLVVDAGLSPPAAAGR